MYEELVKRLRRYVEIERTEGHGADLEAEAADAIEELTGFVQEAERDRDEYRERLDRTIDAIENLSRQRDRAYARLCEWCGVCTEDKRNAEGCEIAALNPEPPKEEE